MVNDRPYGSLAGTPLDHEEEQGYDDNYEEEYDYEGDYDDVDYEYNEIEDGDEGDEDEKEEEGEEYGTYYDYNYEERFWDLKYISSNILIF